MFLISIVSGAIHASRPNSTEPISPVSSVDIVDEAKIMAKIEHLTEKNRRLALELDEQGITDYTTFTVASLAAGDTKAAWQKKKIEEEYCRMELQVSDLQTSEQSYLWKKIKTSASVIPVHESNIKILFTYYDNLPADVDPVPTERKIEKARQEKALVFFKMLRDLKKLKKTMHVPVASQDEAQ